MISHTLVKNFFFLILLASFYSQAQTIISKHMPHDFDIIGVSPHNEMNFIGFDMKPGIRSNECTYNLFSKDFTIKDSFFITIPQFTEDITKWFNFVKQDLLANTFVIGWSIFRHDLYSYPLILQLDTNDRIVSMYSYQSDSLFRNLSIHDIFLTKDSTLVFVDNRNKRLLKTKNRLSVILPFDSLGISKLHYFNALNGSALSFIANSSPFTLCQSAIDIVTNKTDTTVSIHTFNDTILDAFKIEDSTILISTKTKLSIIDHKGTILNELQGNNIRIVTYFNDRTMVIHDSSEMSADSYSLLSNQLNIVYTFKMSQFDNVVKLGHNTLLFYTLTEDYRTILNLISQASGVIWSDTLGGLIGPIFSNNADTIYFSFDKSPGVIDCNTDLVKMIFPEALLNTSTISSRRGLYRASITTPIKVLITPMRARINSPREKSIFTINGKAIQKGTNRLYFSPGMYIAH